MKSICAKTLLSRPNIISMSHKRKQQQQQLTQATNTMTTLSEPILPDLDDEYVDAELDRLYALKLEPGATASLQDIRGMVDSLMSESEQPFASDQILHFIKEYLSKTYGQGEYDTLLTAAYRACLYTNDESTAKEIFCHALKFIGQVGFVRSQRELLDRSDSELECTPEGRDRLKLFADFNLRETEMVVQTADWIFAADVITNEQYAEVIRKIFVERLDLDPSAFNHTIYDFLDDEEYYRLRHGVTEEKLSALYVGIRRSWYIYDSETRKLALSLAQARAGAGVTLFKAEAEDAADDEPTPTVEESEEEEESLGNIHSCINGGKLGEKNDWVLGTDLKIKNVEDTNEMDSSFSTPSDGKDCSLRAGGYLWDLIGVGVTLLAAAASFLRITSVENTQEKRAKMSTCARRSCKKFSFLLRLAFYSLLADSTLADQPSGTVWFEGRGDHLEYEDYCDTGYGTDQWSCLCKTGSTWIRNNGKNSFFVCDDDCYAIRASRVEGYCAQCAAGKFWGNVYTKGQSGYKYVAKECPGHDSLTCACSITTTDEDEDSDQYYFEYVCNHQAKDSDTPRNMYQYHRDGTCKLCPSGTYSEQGDPVCTPCRKGTYNPFSGYSYCSSCPPGSASEESGSIRCKTCPAGTSSSRGKGAYGSTNCQQCKAGYYASEGSDECTLCPDGHFTDKKLGATACKAADAGSYVSASASLPRLDQYKCPVGSYSTGARSHCTSCPENMSTDGPGKTSLSACVKCDHGVDPHSLACLPATEKVGENVCWDASQVLRMNASPAVADLYELVYSFPNVGINALISDAMSVLQGAAKGSSSIEDIDAVIEKLESAPESWLEGLEQNFDSCVASKSKALIEIADADVQKPNLFNYVFGTTNAQNRAEWIARWQCKGATFGCMSFDQIDCPQAQTCFAYLYRHFAPLLNYASVTVFGDYQKRATGKYTPKYNPTFIAQHVEANVASLVQWDNAATSFQRYQGALDAIESGQQFTADAINAANQVDALKTSVSLESSHTKGNLYYKRAIENYDKTYEVAQIVQHGPAHCPDGYEIVPEGIPNVCTDYETLVEQCNKEIFYRGLVKIVAGTALIAAAIVTKAPVFAVNGATAIWKGVNQLFTDLQAESATLLQSFQGTPWDTKTQMPALPETDDDGFIVDKEYADACYKWYLNWQKRLSESLTDVSAATWDIIYMKNRDQYSTTIENPPDCPNHKDAIVDALSDYVTNVEKMSSYGIAMTTASMYLVPAMGDIAIGIATQLAITNANEEISGMVTEPNPSIEGKAPSEYQGVYEDLFFATYEDTSKRILAYVPSASLAQKQYIAAKSINGFCTSYSYMNAGRDYVNIDSDGNKANCKEFWDLYLPTYETFNETVNSFLETCPSGPGTCFLNVPSSVNELNENITGFAANVQGNPEALGQARAEVGDNVQTFTIEFAYDPNVATPHYGSLSDGKIRFTLTPSSSLLLESNNPFTVYDANPRVINVQTYWRGVTSPPPFNQYMQTTINPRGPHMVYLDSSGGRKAYNLPSYSYTDGTSDIYFAQFRSIQRQDNCGTDFTSVETLWRNGEQLYTVDTNWRDGEQLQFCTPYTSDLQEPFDGLADTTFLFPSLWATWEVEADPGDWTSGYYNIDETKLALQVMFRYVASSNPSQAGGPNKCAMNCGIGLSTRDTTPFLGRQWCGANDCGDCVATYSFNGTQLTTDPFCHCNVWDGSHGTCIPGTATTETFTINFAGSPTVRRRLRKRKKEDTDNESVKAGDTAEAKSGKSDSDSESLSEMREELRELLQTYFGECDGSTDAAEGVLGIAAKRLLGNALAKISNCKNAGKSGRHTCDFHLEIPAYNGEKISEVKKNAAKSCIVAKLREDEVREELQQIPGFCDVIIYNNVGMAVSQWDVCNNPFD